MQLCLAHLVDLALGKPEVVSSENFNYLHTLLHVVLKKLNLSDAPVEITDDHAEKAQEILNELPKEPSICFKEFTFRNGVRVKKRTQNQLTAKRSVVQVNKRWPKFSRAHNNTPCTPTRERDDSNVILEDLESLGQRVIALETSLADIKNLFDTQNRVNSCALQDFEKLKCEFQEYRKSCEMVVEEEEEENEAECEDEEIDVFDEIKWLKETMLELSESLKVQSECLKNLKCNEMPSTQDENEEMFENLKESFEKLRLQHKQDVDTLKCMNGNDLKEIKAQFECIKCQISCITSQLQDFEKQFVENQEMTCDELCTLRLDIMDKIQKTLTNTTVRSSHTSAVINTQNLQHCSAADYQDNDCESQFSNDQKGAAICISITQRLNHIQKQVMSQSVCMQQLVRDLACKVDRCEFECYCRKISDTVDTLLQLKHDLQSSANNSAAGTCIPMQSCISCKTSANMTITTSNIPKLPSLKYGRENVNKCPQHNPEMNCCTGDTGLVSNSNWSCYSFKNQRKAGGSHTKSIPNFHWMERK